MQKISTLAASALVVMLCALFAFSASAQTTYPIGNPMDDDNTSLQNNGMMDDTDNTTPGVPNTGSDGMNTMNTMGTSTGTTTPGVPNTGLGGDSLGTWLMLILSGMLAVGGIGYMVTAPRLES